MSIEHEAFCQQCGYAHDRPSDQTYHSQDKECQVCKLTQPLSAFPRSYRSYDGHGLTCLVCLPIQPETVRVDPRAGLVLVIPAFTDDVDLQHVPTDNRHYWQEFVPDCTHCDDEIPTTREHDRDGNVYEICRPVTDDIYAGDLFCSEDCLHSRRDMDYAMSKDD